MRPEAFAQKRLEEGAHRGPRAGRCVEPRELRGGREPRETVVHLVDPGFAVSQTRHRDADGVELTLSAQRVEKPPSGCHRPTIRATWKKTGVLATSRNARVRGLRRKPNVTVGLCALVAVLAGVLVADTQTSAIRDVQIGRAACRERGRTSG